MRKSRLWIISILVILALFCQDTLLGQQVVAGVVYDSSTSLPLPYTTVIIVGTAMGTTSDSEGRFEIEIDSKILSDSIEINHIGYRSVRKGLTDLESHMEIRLTPGPEILDVVIVRPLTPSEYLKRVQRKLNDNTAQHSFNTISHYEEKTTEDERTIAHNEGVFKSWHSTYGKEAEIQHQLALYRREDIAQLEFMKKRAAREKKKYLKKHPEEESKFEEGQLFINDFGGPKSIQQLNLHSRSLFILDSTKHKHFDLQYLSETEYMGNILTVISYESKGKVDDRRFSGQVYLDKETDAVVWIQESGRLIIPLLIRPLLFAMGIEIKSIIYAMELKMRPINDRWYPQFTHWDVTIDIKKNHLIGKNERARFKIKQELETSEILTDRVLKIPESKRFDSDQKMSDQVYTIDGIKW